jgi:hypothetical protein
MAAMTPAPRPRTLRTTEGALLWADYRGDGRRWHHLRPRLEANGVTTAAASVAAIRRFHGVRELREVAWFVAAHNAAAPDEHLLPRLEAEAFVRAALGEPHLLDAVDRRTRAEVARGLLLSLVDDLGLGDHDVHDLLREAEATATEPAGYPPTMGWRPHARLNVVPAPRLPDAMAALVDGDLDDARARALRIAAGPRSREGRWLRALLLNHRGRAAAGVERRAEPVTVALVDRAFVAAVTHHFAPDADLRAIAAVVRGIRDVYGESVPLLETEALIRRALGEDTSAYVLEDRLGLVTRATVLLGLAELWADDLTIVNTVVAEAEELCRLDGLTPTVGS